MRRLSASWPLLLPITAPAFSAPFAMVKLMPVATVWAVPLIRITPFEEFIISVVVALGDVSTRRAQCARQADKFTATVALPVAGIEDGNLADADLRTAQTLLMSLYQSSMV